MPVLINMNSIKVLSLPARHPYTSKFNTGEISFVNPETDLFREGRCTPELLERDYPHENYDIVHIHFSFDKLSIKELINTLEYFKKNRKPIVWTIHSKESQRVRSFGNGQYQKLLFRYADKIISPTNGAKLWVENNLSTHKKNIDIIPLGFMADPQDVGKFKNTVRKDSKLFTYLIGEFRENKEIIQSIVNFLQCSDLSKARLQLIFKPISMYSDSTYSKFNTMMPMFYNIIHNPRIDIISRPEITNTELIKAFLGSHAIILPYKWGTHSGQIELAKDCGCHVVVSDVGFYQEQWKDIIMYIVSDGKYREIPTRYTTSLIEAYHRPSLKPAGMQRKIELADSIKIHAEIYKELIRNIHI